MRRTRDQGDPFDIIPPTFADEVSGRDEAEDIRHLFARRALMDLLLEDPRCREARDRWLDASGIGSALSELARIAQGAGCESIEALLRRGGQLLPEEILAGAVSNVDVILLGLRGEGPVDLAEVLVELVRDRLHLEWPWVAVELLKAFLLHVYAKFVGREVALVYDLLPPPAPPVRVNFQSRTGETAEQAWQRLAEEAVRALSALAAGISPPAGRLPKDEGQHIERYVGWLYAAQCRGETKRGLARAYHADEHGGRSWEAHHDDAKTVRDGIRQAASLLGLSEGWAWRGK